MPVVFDFNPDTWGSSPGFASSLERVFGAARWAHNRAMITQWEAVRKGFSPPSLRALITDCIDKPSEQEQTEWLNLAPREVLIDEIKDLADDIEYLYDIKTFRELPLKKKKEDQEIIFPAGSYRFTDGRKNEIRDPAFSPEFNNGLVLWLDRTGFMPVDSYVLDKSVDTDGVKIERSMRFKYTSTVYFWND